MANPTTNFGWVMPTSSSLVTNLPADFNTFGQAVDTSMSELLGGTTGQVLSKTSNTNMDFTWVTPTDQTPLTTKGDLFTFTTVDARLGVGSDGEVLTASSAAATGLAWATASSGSSNVAGKNGVLNSNFSIWQRGTSIAQTAAIIYGADRWCSSRAGLDVGSTISRQATGDTTNLPFIQYCARVQRNNANTSTYAIYFSQTLETLNSVAYAGKTVTISFYARKGANYSSASSALGIDLNSGTGTDQNVLSTYTGAASVVSQTATLTTTWQRFTYSGTVSSSATELGFYFSYTPVGTAGAADYFEVTGVQLEIAGSASAYSPNTSTQQAELAACQRYYWQTDWTTLGQNAGYGWAEDTTYAGINLYNPVPMRVKASSFIYSNVEIADFVNAATTISSGASLRNARSIYITSILVSASGSPLTQFRSYALRGNGSTGYIGVSAEL